MFLAKLVMLGENEHNDMDTPTIEILGRNRLVNELLIVGLEVALLSLLSRKIKISN